MLNWKLLSRSKILHRYKFTAYPSINLIEMTQYQHGWKIFFNLQELEILFPTADIRLGHTFIITVIQ